MMAWNDVALLNMLFHLFIVMTPVASRCSFSYGRPNPGHCAFITNHLIPDEPGLIGLTYGNNDPTSLPQLNFPVIYFYRESQG